MEDWVKIQTFERIHQAELRKDILEKNNIQAIIINERDSLFLIGEIELYVQKDQEKKAKALINEFEGLTKVNSFILAKPIENLKEILDRNEIYAVIKKKENSKFILDNYELYVRNEDVDKTVPYLTGEKLKDWTKVDACLHTRQTRFRVELLEEKGIDSIIIKKRNSEYHLEEINIYVKNEHKDVAEKELNQLKGWIKIENYNKLHRAEIREDLLGKHGVKSIIKHKKNGYDLYVECSNEEKAIDIINQHREWTKIKSYPNIISARYARDFFNDNDVHAILINRKDRSFLLGEIDLYVDDFKVEKALNLLKELDNIEEK